MPIRTMLMRAHNGISLVELLAFIVIVSVTVISLGKVFQNTSARINDPLINSQLISMAQSQLDEVISRKYDEATPTGGIPACDTGSISCVGIGLDSGEVANDSTTFDDVDDYNNFQDTPLTGYSRQVGVVYAGDDFGISTQQAKRISVSVTAASGQAITLVTYRFNF